MKKFYKLGASLSVGVFSGYHKTGGWATGGW